MSEIDWGKAPEGATHYMAKISTYYECWLKKQGAKWLYMRMNGQAWMRATIDDDSLRTITERPSPAWSGEGLPPVGVVLEVNPDKAGWRKSVISYVGDGFIAWMQVGDLIVPEYGAFIDDCEFRHIRTPEQIAADERTREIRNALTSISHKVEKVNTDIDCSLAIAETVSAMIDAGYRKP